MSLQKKFIINLIENLVIGCIVIIAFLLLTGCQSQQGIIDQTFSDFVYIEDKADEWKMPEQTLAEGGDCEDFVILLRHRLIESGVAPDEIEVIYGKHLAYGHHLVLRYKGVFYDTFGQHKFYPEFRALQVYSPRFFDVLLNALPFPRGD